MALERFVEHFRPDINTYNKVVQARKITESEVSQIKGNVEKLSESTRRYIENNPIVNLSEKTVYRVPISRYDWKNANGRIYPKKLWENVIANQKDSYQGGIGLADHPDDDKDGSFKDQSVVWLNMGLNEGSNQDDMIVWAECVFVGPHGRLAEEIMEAGGRVGFSSSGFGELEESNKENVRWDTYMLERVSDLVLNPSQGVYGKSDMKIKKENTNNIKESVEEKSPMSETIVNAGKISKLEERKFRKDVTQFLSEATEITDPFERLNQLEEINSYFTEGVAPDLKSQVDKYIEETNSEITKAVKEYGKLKEELDVNSTEQIKEGLSKLATDTLFHERTSSEWKAIAEGFQEKNKKLEAVLSARPTAEAYKEAVRFTKTIKQAFIEKEQEWKQSMASARQAYNKQVAINKSMTEELSALSSDNEKLKEKISQYKSYTSKLKESLSEYVALEEAREAKIAEKKLKEDTIEFAPRGTPKTQFSGFNEENKVVDYYEDLVSRHGSDILPYKEALVNCKTVKEAMRIYTKIMSEMGKEETTKISEALDPEERRSLLESQTRTKISSGKKLGMRMPQGWD